jgi:ABC-type nickel/cobalt efflux system permease component RcnA
LISSSAPTTDRSTQLSNYPTDLLNSPPQDLEATAEFTLPQLPSTPQAAQKLIATPVIPPVAVPHAKVAPASVEINPAATSIEPSRESRGSGTNGDAPSISIIRLRANQQKTPRSKFTDLVSAREMTFWFLFPAALIAVGLGALHALEPGHGKTIVAAYLVGSRGTPRHAVLLGVIVTAAHTAGVYLLGAITLYASRWIVPEQLYPWLGITSGLMIVGVASYLLLRVWTGEAAEHSHLSGESHSHWFASLTRPHSAQEASVAAGTLEPKATGVSLRQLLTLGITGGMVPCPAALVVLLSALSLHRVGLGLFLIVAFSLGLAAVLIVIGLLMVHARRFMARWTGEGLVTKRWLPALSSGFMLILGLGITVKALLSTGIGSGVLTRGHLVSFAGIVLLGLFLGMRHSTDPDHVVAVSTIVSRERSVRSAALIGVMWGVGHTLTISVVGSAIILFNVVIPPRIGLSMELSVAVMLVLLGVLNLTGVLRWVTQTFSLPGQPAGEASTINATEVAGGSLDRVVGRFGWYQLLRPLVVGLVHGLAGSAAVALLVLSTIHSPMWAIAYLVVFGIGTIAGMMLMTSAIALPIAYTGNRFARVGNCMGVASGIVSTAFGVFLIYQIGLVDGLFTAQAHWIPR